MPDPDFGRGPAGTGIPGDCHRGRPSARVQRRLAEGSLVGSLIVTGGSQSHFEPPVFRRRKIMEQSFQARKPPFDTDALLHPSKAFRHPLDVVRDTEMTVAEKRSVLASWASDACAIKSNPALRARATGNVVNYDDIIDVLRSLNAERSADRVTYAFKRRQRRRRWSDWKVRGIGPSDDGDVGSSAFG
jgi:hypothetical protein